MQKTNPILIQIETPSWRKVRGLPARLQAAARATLAALPAPLLPAARGAQATLLLTTDPAVRALNRDYRGFDKPTNVLSFPQYDRADLIKVGKSAEKAATPLYVGDIAVAYRTVVRESVSEEKRLADHVTHLVIHGLLHLFGYDHDTPARASRMEGLERRIMQELALPDPYAPVPPKDAPRTHKRTNAKKR